MESALGISIITDWVTLNHQHHWISAHVYQMPMIFLYHIRHWKYRYEESSACSGRFQETAGDTDKKAWWQYVKYVRRQRFANPVTRTHRKSREVGGQGMLSAFHRHPSVWCLQRQTPSWVQEHGAWDALSNLGFTDELCGGRNLISQWTGS